MFTRTVGPAGKQCELEEGGGADIITKKTSEIDDEEQVIVRLAVAREVPSSTFEEDSRYSGADVETRVLAGNFPRYENVTRVTSRNVCLSRFLEAATGGRR